MPLAGEPQALRRAGHSVPKVRPYYLTPWLDMDVIALVYDFKMRILATQQIGIIGHAHACRGNTIPRSTAQMETVRDPADRLVVRCRTAGAGDALAFNTPRGESRQTLAASDLLALVPNFPVATGRRP